MEGRGAAVVGGCEEDSLGQTDAMKTRLQSLRTKLRNEGEHGGRTPILRARSRDGTKYTLHVYAKRNGVLHWDLSDRNADTKEIERVAIDVVGAMKSGLSFGTVWGEVAHDSPVARSIPGRMLLRKESFDCALCTTMCKPYFSIRRSILSI